MRESFIKMKQAFEAENRIPYDIKWLIDKLHVLTTDEEITKDFMTRMEGSDYTQEEKDLIIAMALKHHNDNFDLYKHVMS